MTFHSVKKGKHSASITENDDDAYVKQQDLTSVNIHASAGSASHFTEPDKSVVKGDDGSVATVSTDGGLPLTLTRRSLWKVSAMVGALPSLPLVRKAVAKQEMPRRALSFLELLAREEQADVEESNVAEEAIIPPLAVLVYHSMNIITLVPSYFGKYFARLGWAFPARGMVDLIRHHGQKINPFAQVDADSQQESDQHVESADQIVAGLHISALSTQARESMREYLSQTFLLQQGGLPGDGEQDAVLVPQGQPQDQPHLLRLLLDLLLSDQPPSRETIMKLNPRYVPVRHQLITAVLGGNTEMPVSVSGHDTSASTHRGAEADTDQLTLSLSVIKEEAELEENDSDDESSMPNGKASASFSSLNGPCRASTAESDVSECDSIHCVFSRASVDHVGATLPAGYISAPDCGSFLLSPFVPRYIPLVRISGSATGSDGVTALSEQSDNKEHPVWRNHALLLKVLEFAPVIPSADAQPGTPSTDKKVHPCPATATSWKYGFFTGVVAAVIACLKSPTGTLDSRAFNNLVAEASCVVIYSDDEGSLRALADAVRAFASLKAEQCTSLSTGQGALQRKRWEHLALLVLIYHLQVAIGARREENPSTAPCITSEKILHVLLGHFPALTVCDALTHEALLDFVGGLPADTPFFLMEGEQAKESSTSELSEGEKALAFIQSLAF
jgi:hypothetical protein